MSTALADTVHAGRCIVRVACEPGASQALARELGEEVGIVLEAIDAPGPCLIRVLVPARLRTFAFALPTMRQEEARSAGRPALQYPFAGFSRCGEDENPSPEQDVLRQGRIGLLPSRCDGSSLPDTVQWRRWARRLLHTLNRRASGVDCGCCGPM